ncbi:MAG: STAS domain-containing protein [Ilumatobacteraceae bacterium]
MFVVELLELPLLELNRATEHNLTLMRELALVHTADETGTAPARLLWLSQHLDQQYAAFNAEPRETLQRALEGDQAHIDIRYEVPDHAAIAAERLEAALDEVDQYCRDGQLLTLVTPVEALALRRWLLGEFVTQIRDGAPPKPWSGCAGSTDAVPTPDSTRGAPPVTERSNGPAATVAVLDDLDLEGAARLRGEFAQILEGGVVQLTVDLAACAFIDSVGISLLLTTRERLQEAGGAIMVTNASRSITRTLQTTGVYDILTTGS